MKSRRDTQGSESVMYPFVLIIAMIMLLGFVLSGLTRYAVSGEQAQGDYMEMNYPFGLYDYTTIDADTNDPRHISYLAGALTGYEVSSDDVVDYVPYPEDEDPFIFTDVDENLKFIHVVRDNYFYDPQSTDMFKMYSDFIVVRRHSEKGLVGLLTWGTMGGSWQNAVIPFTTLVDNYDNTTQSSQTDFQLGNSQDTLFLNSTLGGSLNFTTSLYANDFFIYYGWSLFRMEEVDFWNAISMVMYQDIPGVHPIVNWIVHAFFIATVVFIVFSMAKSLIPFLGG